VIEVLDEQTWRGRQRAHAERVRPWIEPRLERRRRGERHPVDDFLFEYYSFRPGQLARWHPGWGVELVGNVAEWTSVRGYAVVDGTARVDASALPMESLKAFAELLRRTSEREAQLGCFGRHEWAMVYRLEQHEVRHPAWPLRVSAAQIASPGGSFVHTMDLGTLAPGMYMVTVRVGVVTPTRSTQADLEQPGCLHAAMDLYKWAFRSYPAIGADLTADCFALAREVRDVDMRVAPYDLSDLGLAPIRIETTEGRAEFVRYQRDFADRGAVLRARLLAVMDAALSEHVSA